MIFLSCLKNMLPGIQRYAFHSMFSVRFNSMLKLLNGNIRVCLIQFDEHALTVVQVVSPVRLCSEQLKLKVGAVRPCFRLEEAKNRQAGRVYISM